MQGNRRFLVIVLLLLCAIPAFTSAAPLVAQDVDHTGGGLPLSPASADAGGRAQTNSSQLVPRIAVVKPIFTATAYTNAFYVFYGRYASSSQTYICTDLNLLNVTVKLQWGWSSQLYTFLTSDEAKSAGLILGQTFIVIDEINVTMGGLFHGGKRIYDKLILGFTEYVTREEYYAYKEFVASGGTLIIMDACNFLAEVRYYPSASPDIPGYLSLVKGHGWEFNGTHAWKSVYARWWDENWNWVGGNYWRYWWGQHYDFFIANTSHPISRLLSQTFGTSIATRYGAHEENLLQNFTDSEVIGYWNLINSSEYPGYPITAYQHRYMNGTVYHSGIMASDVIASDSCMQLFLLGALGLAWPPPPTPASSLSVAVIYALTAIAGVIIIMMFFSVCDMRIRKGR